MQYFSKFILPKIEAPWRLWLILFGMALFGPGCIDENAHIEMSGLNYMGRGVDSFSADGYGGGALYANQGGGGFVCCVTIPRRWRPGMKVTVRWTENQNDPQAWKQKLVTIPEYETHNIGYLAVHFYPAGNVKVAVTNILVGHPNYPYPRPMPARVRMVES